MAVTPRTPPACWRRSHERVQAPEGAIPEGPVMRELPMLGGGEAGGYTLAYRWCGSWRGSAEVRCGGCKWHLTSSCPRGSRVDDLGQPGEFRGSYTNAFACERWEEATEKGAARES
jgi:hypothetical protein